MKLKYILLLFPFTLLNSNTYSQNPIFWNAFNPPLIFDLEDRDTSNNFYIDSMQLNNIWQLASPNKSEFSSAYSGNLALITDSTNFYPINNESSFIFQLFSNDHTELTFNHQFDFDEGIDGGIIELSFDNGVSWINIIDTVQFDFQIDSLYNTAISSLNNQIGFSGSSNGWKNAKFYLRYPQQGTLFKFTLKSDEINNDKEGWVIDDIQFWIIGTPIKEFNGQEIKIYPNPFDDYLVIETGLNSKFNLSICNLNGEIIHKTENILSNNYKLATSNFDAGIYILIIENSKGIAYFKLVK